MEKYEKPEMEVIIFDEEEKEILMGGDVERAPLNYADAYTMLYNWSRDDVEIPDGLTTRAFMDEWNRQIAADAQQH